jgi:hypothetical protein
MNCSEFERVLAEIVDGDRNFEEEEHLGSCPMCGNLVSDLNSISREARFLRTDDAEPSARVWNAIEITLRQEGLIREPQAANIPVARPHWWWRSAWLVPVAAMLIAAGVLQYGHRSPKVETTPTIANNVVLSDDQQLLETVHQRSPAMLASYEANLKNVNAYIRDAEESARKNPNDEAAQRILMNAYEQKSMVYEMALDRSLP